jgi:hypothetical protein
MKPGSRRGRNTSSIIFSDYDDINLVNSRCYVSVFGTGLLYPFGRALVIACPPNSSFSFSPPMRSGNY